MNVNRTSNPRTRRTAQAAATVLLTVAAVSACADSEGPEAGAATTADLQEVEQQLGDLEERVGALEQDGGVGPGEVTGIEATQLFDDPESFLGEQVTVSAEVSELVTTAGTGSAFRIAGESGTPIAVLSASEQPDLEQGDTVRVTGTVKQLDSASLEEDFGLPVQGVSAEGADAEGFLQEEQGQPAISASSIEVIEEGTSS